MRTTAHRPVTENSGKETETELGDSVAAKRCLCSCAANDHARAKALKRRGISKGPKRYPKRSDRIELTGLRAEAASRDFVWELRA
ncbi:hypothetical protein [Xanthomonas phaseoli]|uniref:hypothetical protein n=1 Tax=Xanthomonas phaseoli TaxID=1985254 RepID=UPI000AB403F1|nr:hypothetical protein [Xanthomonas phaseoli]